MANENSFQVSLSSTITAGTQQIAFSGRGDRASGTSFTHSVIATASGATVSVALPTGTLAQLVAKNIDPTNSIHAQTSTSTGTGTHRFATLPPGGIIFLPVAGSTTYYFLSSAGTPTLEYFLLST